MNNPLSNTGADIQEEKRLYQWQNRLMPWMIAMPSVLICAFIIIGTVKLNRFETYLQKGNAEKSTMLLPSPSDSGFRDVRYLEWYSLVKMEELSISRRYNQGGVLLMSRIYIKYLGFFTGMILAIVGSVFIISKLKEEVTELEGSVQEKSKFRFVSSSPGIIFGVLGTVLMMTTIVTHSEITVKDMPLYLNAYNISATQKAIDTPTQKTKKSTIDQTVIDKFIDQLDSAR